MSLPHVLIVSARARAKELEADKENWGTHAFHDPWEAGAGSHPGGEPRLGNVHYGATVPAGRQAGLERPGSGQVLSNHHRPCSLASPG